jgi:ketosteroid isomerase-like protein
MPSAIIAAMESQNVQVVRRLERLFNDRDLGAYMELYDPSVEWQVSDEDPDATVHRGREQVRAYLEGWIDAFGDLRIHIEDLSEAGDTVQVVLRFTGQGTGSGAPLEERFGFVFHLHDGRVTKVEDLGRRERAPQA